MPRRGAIRVVLADDDPGFLDALATAMETDGRFEVVGLAGDGIEAVELARWLDPDVAVLDVNMPRLGGIEAAGRLRGSEPRTRVLLVSSAASEVGAHAGVEAPIMPKLDLDDVLESVAQLAAGPRD
jgi:DNA-binding NarL/FixJ family response regulator